MAVVLARTLSALADSKDFKADVKSYLGDMTKVKVFFNYVLVANYVRPVKTSGGIIRPDTNIDEDAFQGKVGLVLKKGPSAFVSDAEATFDVSEDVEVDDWVVYRVGDGFQVTIRGVACRMLPDRAIKM